MFCFHKYNKVEDGYQYCKKCGKAKIVPCSHQWEILKEISVYTSFFYSGSYPPNHYIFALRCSRCGNIKKEKTR